MKTLNVLKIFYTIVSINFEIYCADYIDSELTDGNYKDFQDFTSNNPGSYRHE